MKPLICLVFILILCSCNNTEEQNNKNKKDSVLKPAEIHNITTGMKIKPLRQLPSGFKLDSIKKTDTTLNHQMTYYFPVSLKNNNWNKKLHSFIHKLELDYYPEKTNEEFQSSVFDLWVTSFIESNKKIQFNFMMQSYYHGSAHYNQDSVKYNYPSENKN
jgi:hypothetical protein